MVAAGNPDVSYTYKIIGKPELACVIRRKYTLKIMDNAGNEARNVAFTWDVVSDFEVEQIVNGNQITLCADDERAAGSTFKRGLLYKATLLIHIFKSYKINIS